MTRPVKAAQEHFAERHYDSDACLRVEGLACVRGAWRVFVDCSFEVKAGEAVMIAGPNGAGKSSLLRQLAGLLPVAAGQIEHRQATSLSVHYLGHEDGLKAALSIGETMAFEAALAGGKSLPDNFDIAAFLGLPRTDWHFVGDLSAGQKRRLSLSRLLLDPRPLWLLDEPLTALDADGRGLVSGLAKAHLAVGGMIVAASHEPLDFATGVHELGGAS